MKAHLIAAASASVMAGLTLAQGAAAQSVEVKDAVARVVVIPEDRRDIGVEIVPGRADLPALQVVRRGDDVRIDGGLGTRRLGLGQVNVLSRCESGDPEARQPGQGARIRVRGVGEVALEDAPMVVLRTPRDVDIETGEAVYGAVGPGARSVELHTGGCGQWTVANVSGPAAISVGGSGRVRIGEVQQLKASIGGSGSVTARAAHEVKASIGGSGDVRVGRVEGPIEVRIGGSGDVRLDSGRSEQVDVSIAGSGNVHFDGTAGRVAVATVGSGDVYIREVTGPISRSTVGSGKLRIGD